MDSSPGKGKGNGYDKPAKRAIKPHWLGAFYSPIVVAALVSWIVVTAVLGRGIPVKVISSAVTTPQVPPGGVLAIERHVEWLRKDCTDVKISAELIDSLAPSGYHHAMGVVDLGPPRPEAENTSRSWQVPFAMPWGETTYMAHLTFSCFPFYDLWPIEVALPPLKFAIIEPDPKVPVPAGSGTGLSK